MRCNAHKQQGIEGNVSKDNTVNYKTCSHCPFHGHLAVCIVQVRTKSFLSHSIDVLCLFTARLFTDHDPHPHKKNSPQNQYFNKLYKLTHITRNIFFFFFFSSLLLMMMMQTTTISSAVIGVSTLLPREALPPQAPKFCSFFCSDA